MRPESQSLEGIAIVGMAGRFPHARNISEYWANLCAGRECLDEFTEAQIAAAGVPAKSLSERRVRSRGVVPDVDCFDASFFGYSPREAEVMDPQQRILLELAWEALEDAGFDPDAMPGPVGVFAGVGINTYFHEHVRARPDVLDTVGMFPAVVLNEKDFVATRIAYKMNLRGPAITVQTACSTSLVAVCSACQSLLSYECDVALAGAAAAVFPQCHSYIHEEGGMIAPDGHCRPFDAKASGTLFSDGAGVVVLRRLEDAVAAGDNILAVIKGFAVNNDGSDKAGFSAPSVHGQAEVVRMAQEFAGISPESVSYIEAHGTATPLGDPIEIAALTEAFRKGTRKTQFCAIGSVKSNIGHLDVAAGVAGLIKTVLALRHRLIPPTIHFEEANPKIDFANSPFYVADKLTEWKRGNSPRRAGVSSFGIGGTNAHVVLEEAPEAAESGGDPRGRHLLVLSAKTPEALGSSASNLAHHLRANGSINMADVASTLQSGRRAFTLRRALVCQDAGDAIAALDDPTSRPLVEGAPGGCGDGVVFMFPGQGAQSVGMGRELYETELVFRQTLDVCAEALRPRLGLDLRDLLYPEPGREQWAEDQLVQTRFTQPALFSVEYALAQLWRSYGVEPAAMIGHSVGEYVAACVAGVFSLEDALLLVAERGRLIQEQPGGSMMIVRAAAEEISPRLNGSLSLAAQNAPSLCVVSGPHEKIGLLESELAGLHISTRRLHTSHAFHSSMMEPALAAFEEVVRSISLHAPSLPFISNVTGSWADPNQVSKPEYWTGHVREAVRFAAGAEELLKREYAFLEVGPGSTLSTLMRQQAGFAGSRIVASTLPVRKGSTTEVEALLEAVGSLWVHGVAIDWNGFRQGREIHRVSLPPYAFQRQRHWLDPATKPEARSGGSQVVTMPQRPRPEVVEPKAPPSNPTIESLRLKLVELSGLAVGPDADSTPFFELGLDSLQLAQFCRIIETAYGVRIPAKHFVHPRACLRSIADILDETTGRSSQSRPPSVATASRGAIDSELKGIQSQITALTKRVDEITASLRSKTASGL